ncbi:MlaE family ABC transporter permease [Catenovulum sediminis]|uniref:MlaE family ABC transporter permease n=1 Tax=Catenovulum sediminis TaxID=1740262 RepID=UPI00117FB3ED|nr:ABC transporter permease [Catenovulum sediminis]
MIGLVGHYTRSFFTYMGDITGLLTLTIKEIKHLTHPARRAIFFFLFKRQLFNTGVRAIGINTAIAIIIGSLMMARLFALLPPGKSMAEFYANFFVIVVIRELGPLISGIILIARSATAITAEIGHLKLYNEFEVLQAQKMSPIFIFLLPVFFAFPLSLLLMFIFFNAVSILSAYFVILLDDPTLSFTFFLSAILSKITMLEVIITLCKALIGGSLIGLISLHFSGKVGGRFTDISRAISSSTTAQLIAFFTLNVGLSLLAYQL